MHCLFPLPSFGRRKKYNLYGFWTMDTICIGNGITLWKFHCEEMWLQMNKFSLANVFGLCVCLRPCTSHCCRSQWNGKRTLLSMSSSCGERSGILVGMCYQATGTWLEAFMSLLSWAVPLFGRLFFNLLSGKFLNILQDSAHSSLLCRFSGALWRGNVLYLYYKEIYLSVNSDLSS